MSTVIEKDMVLDGQLWPEPVRVLGVEHFGSMLQIDAVGTRTRQFYPGIIVTAEQAEGLEIVSSAKGMDFSGDPEAFHLAIEALRIRLAYEYDPHFAVNASAITPLPHQFDAAYRQGVRAKKTRKTRLYRLGEELSVRTKHLLLLTARDAALVATVDGLNRRISIQLDGSVRSPSTAPNRGEA